ncbi:MAG TPA: GNAT family protein [Actinomycetota bacterium]|jgi:RimJ/RimL family protein N-acetyltransferase|nr:GNAT family protein [Actinomycetota bacterium]
MEVRPLADADALAISAWQYPGRDSTYDVNEVFTSEQGVWAVDDGSKLVGYCCFGPEARVPGIDEEEGTVDVGYGMAPDLVGRGLGRSFVAAILDFAVAEFSPQRFRLLILSWNQRSLKVAEALGFEQEGVTPSVEGDFVIMVRPVFT